MAAKTNLTTTSDITVTAREVDFVSRFTQNWEALREIMNIMRPIKKDPGTKLTSYKASITLQSGAVGEGEEIPYSKAKVEPVSYSDLTLEKYAKAVSIEAVNKYGAVVAVQKTDEAFLNELQGKVLDRFYSFLQTGTLTATESSFQMAIAVAIGSVKNKFKEMRKDSTNIIVFVNIMDAYRYLGAADLSVQTLFGIDYLQNFMGASTLVMTSEIPSGKVIAVPADNIVLYYVDAGDADFRQLGLNYTVQGETNLIGFHANGDYSHAVGESYALMGMALWAEYIDGIAVVTVANSSANLSALTIGSLTLSPTFDADTTSYTATTSNATNQITATPKDSNATVTIHNGETEVENGASATWASGANNVKIDVTNGEAKKTYMVTVTKT